MAKGCGRFAPVSTDDRQSNRCVDTSPADVRRRRRDAQSSLRRFVFALFLGVLCFRPALVWGDGHGPAFGYSTTILGAGDSSISTALMWRSGVSMISPQFSYGVTENVQLSVSTPLHLDHGDHPVGRFTAMMPGDPSAEVIAAWRFHHSLTGVGTRNESTLYVGLSGTTQLAPRADGPSLQRAPGYYVAAATGHISRRYYVWLGGGYQHEGAWNRTNLDHQSDSLLTSIVLGWRPPFFDREYPKPDMRFFWETTGENIGQAWRGVTTTAVVDTHHGAPAPAPAPGSDIVVLPNSGGAQVFSGPSFLYTYRGVAFQAGVLFPLWCQMNGSQPAEKLRAVVGVSYYFLKGRR